MSDLLYKYVEQSKDKNLLELNSQHRGMKKNIQKQCPLTCQGYSYPFSLFQELLCVAAVQFSDSPEKMQTFSIRTPWEKRNPKATTERITNSLRCILFSDYKYQVGLMANGTLLWLHNFPSKFALWLKTWLLGMKFAFSLLKSGGQNFKKN